MTYVKKEEHLLEQELKLHTVGRGTFLIVMSTEGRRWDHNV
jgi:hypothetical protein